MSNKLHFSLGNAKLPKDTAVLSLPAGHTCPFAKECRSQSDRVSGKISDGKDCKFRCYATSPECLFPNIRKCRWNNLELIRNAKTVLGMANLIESSLMIKRNIKMVRFHQSGDFFNQAYFDAWLLVAKLHPEWIFYGYTKALPLWAKRVNDIPPNMRIVASRGGTHDILIDALGLRSVKVVFTEDEAKQLKLEIDHDDSLCWKGTKDFAILLHGTQPKHSLAGKAWHKIKTKGRGGYKSDYFGHSKNKSKHGSKSLVLPVIDIKKNSLTKPTPHALWNSKKKLVASLKHK